MPDKSISSTDYKGFPYFSSIDSKVVSELNLRKSQQYTTKIAWVNLISGVKKNDNKLKTLNKIDYTEIYKSNTRFQPPVGIIDVSIKYLTEYGGVRKASIKWKTYNLLQLEEFAPYFLNPGHTMILEWGWGNTNVYNSKKYLDEFIDNEEAYKIFLSRSKRHNYNYDGMLGIVTNIDINGGDNGGFELTTEITSKGSLIYGLNVTNQATDISGKKDLEKTSIKEYIKNDLVNDITTKKYGPQDGVYIDTAYSAPKQTGQYGDSGAQSENKELFVTWGFLEDKIVTNHIGIPRFKLNSTDSNGNSNIISNSGNLLTTNLNVCILPQKIVNNPDGNSIPPEFSFNNANISSIYTPGTYPGNVRNIYVNVNLIKDVFANSDKLTEALITLLDHINGACLDFWNFKLKVRESDNVMEVIDLNYNKENILHHINDAYRFTLYGGNSIIKTFEFNSNMPNDMQASIYFSSIKSKDEGAVVNLRDDTFTNIWKNDGTNTFTDAFITPKEYKISEEVQDSVDRTHTDQTTEEQIKDIRENKNNKSYSDYLKNNYLPKPPEDSNFYSSDTYMTSKVMKGGIYGNNVLLPIDLNITINGISGLRIGDIFTVDFLPKKYKTQGLFQIKSIDHSISDNFWETNITAGLRISGKTS